jgi:hypothetical protein
VEVELPPRSSPRKFQDINDDSEDASYSPPPPATKQRRKAESQAESAPDPSLHQLEIFVEACDRCLRGKRDCEVEVVGVACLGCKAHKYGCSHKGKTELKTMWVTRPGPDSDSEVEVVDDRKGKKRKAESPAPVKKRKAPVKQEKGEKVTKKRGGTKGKVEKGKVESQGKASGSKPTARRRAAPKSSAVVVNSSEDEDEAMVVDEEESAEEPPKTKRVRVAKGKCRTN